MATLSLGAIDPYWLCVIDCYYELDRAGPSTQRLESREEAIGERVTGVGEAALYHRVVLGKVAEREGVADCGGDCRRIEGELGICADSDRMVNGEDEREESQQRERKRGMHN